MKKRTIVGSKVTQKTGKDLRRWDNFFLQFSENVIFDAGKMFYYKLKVINHFLRLEFCFLLEHLTPGVYIMATQNISF